MSTNQIKLIAIAIFLAPLLAVVTIRTNKTDAATLVPDDVAAIYKAKCSMCHTPTASKFFDGAKTDEEYVPTILKGKKGEKPPYMPAFEEKGITADMAKELAGYMKQLKTAPK